MEKCSGEGCPIAGQCKRFTEPSTGHQEWMLPTWDDEGCENYVSARPHSTKSAGTVQGRGTRKR